MSEIFLISYYRRHKNIDNINNGGRKQPSIHFLQHKWFEGSTRLQNGSSERERHMEESQGWNH